jgi:hypothetical protein
MRTRFHTLAAALPAAAALLLSAHPAAASADVTVTNQNDSGPGSLRQAIADAAPGDRVVVPAGTYMLTSELVVAKNLTIAGAGSSDTAIDAQTASRVFHTMGAGNQVTISGMTIRDGKAVPPAGTIEAKGGGVLNEQATLTLSDDLIAANQAFASTLGTDGNGGTALGGGVFSTGRLNLVRTVVRGNSASAVGAIGKGGGIADGGGVAVIGSIDIRGSTFDDNIADARGGQGDVDPKQVGGVASGGGLSLAQNGPATMSGTTFTRNEADGSSGAGSSTGQAFGGGAALEDNTGGISQSNVTYTANLALALAGQTFGGAIYFQGDQGQSLTNATLSGNTATAGTTNFGGNIYVSVDETATLENTIVSGGAADSGFENCYAFGTITSRGHNIESARDCRFTAPGDLQSTDPQLAAPTDNGGPVQTMALHAGSPAVDAGAGGVCPSTDARGVLRPAGGACDIGAFEIATPGAATAPATGVTPNAAILGGIASNPGLAGGRAFFEYGKTIEYGRTTQTQAIAPLTDTAHLSASVADLSPSTTYHFQLVVINATGTVRSSDQTFITPAVDRGLGNHGTGGPGDPGRAGPRITALKIAPVAVSPGHGAMISYIDSAASTTTLAVQRAVTGRVQGRSCVRQTRRNRHHRSCIRWVTVGPPFIHNDIGGSQRFRLPPAAITRRPIARYRLAATPRANGLTGRTVTAGFRLVRR